MQSQFAEMLEHFGESVGLEGLELNESGACSLVIDDLVVNMETSEEAGQFFMYSVLGDMPEAGKEEVYAALLGANVFFEQTHGATLGVDENTGVVLLQYQTPLGALTENQFFTVMEDFANVAEAWAVHLEKLGAVEPEHNEPEQKVEEIPAPASMPMAGMRV